LYWSRVGRLAAAFLHRGAPSVAILIVLEQGWKQQQRKLLLVFAAPVAILIVLEQGWKLETAAGLQLPVVVAILIVLEQGWKIAPIRSSKALLN